MISTVIEFGEKGKLINIRSFSAFVLNISTLQYSITPIGYMSKIY